MSKTVKLEEMKVLNTLFKVGCFFGIGQEQRFYEVISILNDRSLTLNVYSIKENKAYLVKKSSVGYSIDFFRSRNEKNEIWTAETPPFEVIEESVKNNEKTFIRSKSIETKVLTKQGELF